MGVFVCKTPDLKTFQLNVELKRTPKNINGLQCASTNGYCWHVSDDFADDAK